MGAGGKMGISNFRSGILYPDESSVPKTSKGVADFILQNAEANTSFSYIVSHSAIYYVIGYLTTDKSYGVINVISYIKENNIIFRVRQNVVEQL